jgi:hypothetical protein
MQGTLIPLDPLIPLSGILRRVASRECRTVRLVGAGEKRVELGRLIFEAECGII